MKVAVALPLIEPLIGNSASSGNPDFGVKMMAAPYREGGLGDRQLPRETIGCKWARIGNYLLSISTVVLK